MRALFGTQNLKIAGDGKAVASIEKITIADKGELSESWFKSEILDR